MKTGRIYIAAFGSRENPLKNVASSPKRALPELLAPGDRRTKKATLGFHLPAAVQFWTVDTSTNRSVTPRDVRGWRSATANGRVGVSAWSLVAWLLATG